MRDRRKESYPGDGVGGADTHDSRRDTNRCSSDVFADNGQTELLCDASPREQYCSGAVADLGRVTGVGAAGLGERGFELGEALLRDAVSDTIVKVDGDLLGLLGLGVDPGDLDGENLVFEAALLLGFGGLLEGGSGEGVLDVAGDVVVGGDILRGDSHWNGAVLGLLSRENGVGEALGLGGGTVAGGHALNACANTNVNHAGLDLVCNVADGGEAAGALAVYGVD